MLDRDVGIRAGVRKRSPIRLARCVPGRGAKHRAGLPCEPDGGKRRTALFVASGEGDRGGKRRDLASGDVLEPTHFGIENLAEGLEALFGEALDGG